MNASDKFDAAMKKILSVSKVELQRRIEEDKRNKPKPSSSRVPASS
jgi:hypothetical protein